jgi:O-antigen ligase
MNINFKKAELISYILSVIVIISPFLFLQFGKSPFEFPKFIFSLIIAQCLAIILLFKNINITKNKLLLLISLFVLITFIADMLGFDPRTSLLGGEYRFQGLLLLLAGFIFALAASVLKNKLIIYRSIIISSLALSVITILQFLLLITKQPILNYNGRIVATLGNPNFIGAYLAMTLPFLLSWNLKNKFLKLLLIFIPVLAVLISCSLSAILATTIILTIFAFIKLWQHNKKNLFGGIVILIISVLVIILGLGKSIYRYSQWDNRFLIWDAGIKSVSNHPLLGIGQENFELIFPKNMHYKVDNAHNIFLETVVSSGSFGLLIFFTILFVKFKKRNFVENLSILGFLIAGLFNPLPIICLNLFWIIIGLY